MFRIYLHFVDLKYSIYVNPLNALAADLKIKQTL